MQKHQSNFEFSVLFGQSPPSSEASPAILNYTILAVDNNYQTDQQLWNDYFEATMRSADHYIEYGFVTLQGAIDEAFAQMVAGEDQQIDMELIKMPSNIRKLFKYQTIAVPMVILWLVYVFSLINTVLVPAVEEKESGIKEFLRIASSYSYLNMATFFVIKLLIGLVIFAVTLSIFSVYGLTQHFQMIYMVVLVLLYLMSTIAFTFMISVIFNTG